MGINFNPNTNIKSLHFQTDKPQQIQNRRAIAPDTFVRESKEAYYARRLEEIFPNNELQATYDKICDKLDLDYKPQLVLQLPTNGFAGGGYTFFTNKINLSLEDTLGSDTKLYSIKDGEKKLETDTKTGLPKMTSKLIAAYITSTPEAARNVGVDKLVAEPASNEEIKKLFIQKLYHELIHAKQHQIMRKTENIGTKEILRAWNHSSNKKIYNKAIENIQLEQAYQKSFWAKKESEEKYAYNSEIGEYARNCLNAITNYPPVDSPEYVNNFLEKEAFQKALEYIETNYGKWE